jgi:hypothetical protein
VKTTCYWGAVPPARKRQWKDTKKAGPSRKGTGGSEDEEEEYMPVSEVYRLMERMERKATAEMREMKELVEDQGDEIAGLKELLREELEGSYVPGTPEESSEESEDGLESEDWVEEMEKLLSEDEEEQKGDLSEVRMRWRKRMGKLVELMREEESEEEPEEENRSGDDGGDGEDGGDEEEEE